jgi:hypothetical protein
MVRNGETPLRSHPPPGRARAEGEEMNANESFKGDEKSTGQWFLLVLVAFTIIDYFLLGHS